MSKHTPGPWKIIDKGDCVFVNTPTDGTYSGLISLPGNHSEQLRLAHLIVAVPDMLAALEVADKAMFPTDKDGIPLQEWDKRLCEAGTIIQNAIAKAEGRR